MFMYSMLLKYVYVENTAVLSVTKYIIPMSLFKCNDLISKIYNCHVLLCIDLPEIFKCNEHPHKKIVSIKKLEGCTPVCLPLISVLN